MAKGKRMEVIAPLVIILILVLAPVILWRRS